MILRNIFNKIKNKKFKIIIMFSLLIYLLLYFLIKNEFFYNATQYTTTYLNYYINTYLSNIADDLIFDNGIIMYIESDVQNIFSSLFLYAVSFNNKIFLIFSIIMTLYVFYYISSIFYNDVFNNGAISKVFRIGEKKYLNDTIITNSIYCGLLFLIPKILYFILLNVFFPNGVSYVHFLGQTSFLSEKFLYIAYNCSPIMLVCLDFAITFLYGIIISLISLIIISIIKNKSLSYIAFIFFISSISIIQSIFNLSPLIFYNSIYNYFNFYTKVSLELNVFEPIIFSVIISSVLYIITRYILRYRIRMRI